MRRFLGIFSIYALVAAAIFVLQWIPQTGIFLMFMLGMFWIGVVVHVFMIHITLMSIMGALPRFILIVPATFYAAGFAMGLSSDIPASRWQSQQRWLQIDKQVPPDTRYLAFADAINLIGVEQLNSSFQPEKLGFELFVLGSRPNPDLQLIFDPACPTSARMLAGRCYTTHPFDRRPYPYVLIGGAADRCAGVTQFSWAIIYPNCESVRFRLNNASDDQIVGRLSGAIVRKRSYFLFPTAGCALVDSPPSWPCQWSISPLWRDAFVGYRLELRGSSPGAASILMAALAQLRGQTTHP